MGLALHNHLDSSCLSNLLEDRHPPAQSEAEENTQCPFFFTTERYETLAERRECQRRRRLRARQLQLQGHSHPASSGGRPPRRAHMGRDLDEKEGRDLARSPGGDGGGRRTTRRPPSLERQEAFRDGRTAKKRVFPRRSGGDGGAGDDDDDDDDPVKAELYRLGLLYDDEHERGSGFTFDAIARSEPAYRLNLRSGKRGRKARGPSSSSSGDEGDLGDLPLDLSFAALGEDEALARFLVSPGEEGRGLARGDGTGGDVAGRNGAARIVRPSVTVIYELETDGSTSVSFQESTVQTQTTHDLPDLIPDNGSEHDREEVGDEETGEWEMVQTRDAPAPGGGGGGGGDATATATATATTPANPDAWVVLD